MLHERDVVPPPVFSRYPTRILLDLSPLAPAMSLRSLLGCSASLLRQSFPLSTAWMLAVTLFGEEEAESPYSPPVVREGACLPDCMVDQPLRMWFVHISRVRPSVCHIDCILCISSHTSCT